MRLTIRDLLDRSRSHLERLTPRAAALAMSQGAVLIDTRCQELRQRDGVVPGALHIPLSVLFWRLDPTSDGYDPASPTAERRVILLCEHGYSSSLAAATLQQLGFVGATDVQGGFAAWAHDGLEVVACL